MRPEGGDPIDVRGATILTGTNVDQEHTMAERRCRGKYCVVRLRRALTKSCSMIVNAFSIWNHASHAPSCARAMGAAC